MKKLKSKIHESTTFYKRNAGFTSKNEYLAIKELYGELKVCASKFRTTLILPLCLMKNETTNHHILHPFFLDF